MEELNLSNLDPTIKRELGTKPNAPLKVRECNVTGQKVRGLGPKVRAYFSAYDG